MTLGAPGCEGWNERTGGGCERRIDPGKVILVEEKDVLCGVSACVMKSTARNAKDCHLFALDQIRQLDFDWTFGPRYQFLHGNLRNDITGLNFGHACLCAAVGRR